MSEKLKIPTRNKHGLVIPPNVATLKTEKNHERRICGVLLLTGIICTSQNMHLKKLGLLL